MSEPLQNNDLNLEFRVLVVEKTDPPEGMEKGNWYRYVIGHERSKIECIRSGTEKAVTLHAESYAQNLNSRSLNGYSAYSPRKQQAKNNT